MRGIYGDNALDDSFWSPEDVGFSGAAGMPDVYAPLISDQPMYQTAPAVSYDYSPAANYGVYNGYALDDVSWSPEAVGMPNAPLIPDQPMYQTAPAVSYEAAPAADYGMATQSTPVAQATQAPVGALSYTASGMPYTSNPNMTLEEFLAASAQGPRAQMPSTMAIENYLASSRNAGLPANLQYTPITQTLNPNYNPSAQFSLPPGSEFTMTDQERQDAYINWLRDNQQYQTKSWMISTDPTGYGGTHLTLQSGNPYVLRNNATGEIVAQGSDDATLEKIANLISSGSLGDKWQLFEPGQSSYGNLTAGLSPEDAASAGNTGYGNSEYVEGKDGQPGYWLNPIGGAKPAPSFLGQFLGTALKAWGLPVAGAYLGPAIQAANAAGTIATPLGAALAGAATGAAGSAVSGGNILKGALLGGATSFGLNQLASAVGPGALSGGGGDGAGGSPGSSSFGPEGITVVGSSVPTFIAPSLSYGGGKVPTDVNTSDLKNGALPTSVDTTGINPMEFAPPSIDASAVDVGGALPSVEPNQIVVSGGTTAPPSFPVPTGALTTATTTPEKPLVEVVGQPTETDTTTPPLTVDNLFEGLSAPTTTPEKPLVEVVGQPTKEPTTPVTAGPLTTATTTAEKPLVEVVGQPTKTDTTTAPVTAGPLTTATTTTDKPLVEVVGQPTKEPTTPGLYTPSIIETATLTGLSPQEVLDASNTKTEPPKSPIDKIADYLQIAGLGIGLLDSLGGGGGGGGTAKIPGGLGAKNPIYTAPLPTPGQGGAFVVGGLGGPGGLGGNTGPGIAGISPPGGDYTRYGMGNAPLHVAPSNIPQYGGVNPPGFNTDTWEWLGPQTGVAKDILDQLAVLPGSAAPASAERIKNLEVAKNYAMGGYAVGGPGDGRSDEIPAMLSDGEYVVDAETVALLGNGSNKAGAQALDRFRANIRKHKGRELARGDFSAKAKKPEAYLSGGRS